MASLPPVHRRSSWSQGNPPSGASASVTAHARPTPACESRRTHLWPVKGLFTSAVLNRCKASGSRGHACCDSQSAWATAPLWDKQRQQKWKIEKAKGLFSLLHIPCISFL